MASQYFAILTDYGTRAIAHALSQGQPLQLAKFAVGDGNGQAVTPTASATALVHQTHIAPVSAVSLDPRNNKQVIVELTIPENVGGFYIREMGVFDSQNKLIAYANCPESFKPTESSGSGKVQVLRMILKVESSSAVTLSIDNSVIFVTRQQMAPKTITATTQNGFDESGHTHEIAKASTTQQGIVQLTNDTGLESESLALTAKAGKKLAQLIATVQLALNNYIPLNKRSSAVNSNDENNVATSKAVKTAYDKGVEAKNAADDANSNANGRVPKTGDTTIIGTVRVQHQQLNAGRWSELQLAAKQGYWQLEVNPNSHDANERRFNMVYANGNAQHYLWFPTIGDSGQTVAYQSWVDSRYLKLDSGYIKFGDVGGYGGIERIYGGKPLRYEWDHDQFKLFAQDKYSILFPKKTGTVALLGDLDGVWKELNNTYRKERFKDRWYPSHYNGAQVFDIPTRNDGGLRIIAMNVTFNGGTVELNLPEAFDGHVIPSVVDVGDGRKSLGISMVGNNKVKVYAPGGRVGVQIQVMGFAHF